MKQPAQTFPTLDVVAAIYAATEHRNKLAAVLNSKFDMAQAKPSAPVWIPVGDSSDDLPSVTEYAKKTLGIENKWMSEKAESVTVTDAHRKQAEDAIATITSKVMMMVLKGQTVNGFIASLNKVLEKDEVTARDFGLLTYTPKTAAQYQATEAVDEKKTQFMDSRALGSIGDKVFATVTIFNSRVMPQYNSILYEGNGDSGNLVTFFKNETAKDHYQVDSTYKINARIKACGPTAYSFGAVVNTLNYVRKVK